MVGIKAHQADRFISSLDRRYCAILVYGGDSGLISERARSAAARLAAVSDPPGEILRIEDSDLELDPERLVVELQTMPMFGGPKIVLTRASRRVTAQTLRPMIEMDTLAAAIVVEAGNLRPDDALRAMFEKSSTAAAIACYADEPRDLEALVRTTLQKVGLKITTEAEEALVARLGADRSLSRGEVEKLMLYVRGRNLIELDDVDAVVGDAAELAVDRGALAVAGGKLDVALTEMDRIVASGESPQTVVAAIQRYFIRLHRLRAATEAGKSLEDALRQIRPPVHFKLRPQLEAHCRRWTLPNLSRGLQLISVAAKAGRLSAALEQSIAERLLIDLADVVRTRALVPH